MYCSLKRQWALACRRNTYLWRHPPQIIVQRQSMYACGFSVPQMRQFCLFTYPPRSKWASSEKIFWKSIAGLLSEAKTHWMVYWLQLLNQLNFVQRHTKVFMQNSSQWCPWNVQLLRKCEMHSSNILGCMHCFWLFTMRMSVTFTFFTR